MQKYFILLTSLLCLTLVSASTPILYLGGNISYYPYNNPLNFLNTTSADLFYYGINNSLNFLNTTSADLLYYGVSNPLNFLNQTENDLLYYGIGNPLNFVNVTGNIFDQSLNTSDSVSFVDIHSLDWSNVSITQSQVSDLVSGNPFDQSLNTTDDVVFNNLNVSNLTVSGGYINLPLSVWKVGNYEVSGNFSGICYNGSATIIGTSFNLTEVGC